MMLINTKNEGNEITTKNLCEQKTLRTQLGFEAPHFRLRKCQLPIFEDLFP
jgi:hypothetical protein